MDKVENGQRKQRAKAGEPEHRDRTPDTRKLTQTQRAAAMNKIED
jgi:hypothetical protein